MSSETSLLLCVPNFSEGRNPEIIEAIRQAILSQPDVIILGTDIHAGANRSVISFVAPPEQAVAAMYEAFKVAVELIDMREHTGCHPRMGAVDVVPFVPFEDSTMEEAIYAARTLGQLVAEEMRLPVYLYGSAAIKEGRDGLPAIRKGEYEGFRQKMTFTEWWPDYGPAVFNARSGQSAIGAREMLVAYNVTLETQDVQIAKKIAAEIREYGSLVMVNGVKMLDKQGKPVRRKGLLKGVRAIGWYEESLGAVQVSCNLVNLEKASLHETWETVQEVAEKYGTTVVGSEIVGLAPAEVLMASGRYFAGMEDEDDDSDRDSSTLIATAVEHLGLNHHYPFVKEEKLHEYAMLASMMSHPA